MANTQIRTGNDKQTEIKHLYGDYIIYLTQRAQRLRSFNFPYCSRWRWRCRKFHYDKRTQRQGGLNEKSENSSLIVQHSPLNVQHFFVVSVVGTLRAASVLYISLSALDVCRCFRTLHATSLLLDASAHRSPFNSPSPSVPDCASRL